MYKRGDNMDEEKLNKIRGWLVENIFRNPDIMLSDNRYIEIYGNPGERETIDIEAIDIADVIASLYEALHISVVGEPYRYMFHWANKAGSWVDDNLFDEIIYGKDNND